MTSYAPDIQRGGFDYMAMLNSFLQGGLGYGGGMYGGMGGMGGMGMMPWQVQQQLPGWLGGQMPEQAFQGQPPRPGSPPFDPNANPFDLAYSRPTPMTHEQMVGPGGPQGPRLMPR